MLGLIVVLQTERESETRSWNAAEDPRSGPNSPAQASPRAGRPVAGAGELRCGALCPKRTSHLNLGTHRSALRPNADGHQWDTTGGPQASPNRPWPCPCSSDCVLGPAGRWVPGDRIRTRTRRLIRTDVRPFLGIVRATVSVTLSPLMSSYHFQSPRPEKTPRGVSGLFVLSWLCQPARIWSRPLPVSGQHGDRQASRARARTRAGTPALRSRPRPSAGRAPSAPPPTLCLLCRAQEGSTGVTPHPPVRPPSQAVVQAGRQRSHTTWAPRSRAPPELHLAPSHEHFPAGERASGDRLHGFYKGSSVGEVFFPYVPLVPVVSA